MFNPRCTVLWHWSYFCSWSFTILLQGAPWWLCVLLLSEECGGNTRQAAIHIIHSKLQFPSSVPSIHYFCNHIYNSSVARIPLWRALVHYQSIPTPGLYKLFSFFWVVVLTLQFSILISGVKLQVLMVASVKSTVWGNVVLCSSVSANSAVCLLSMFMGFLRSSG
jgi:hypothetical protein